MKKKFHRSLLFLIFYGIILLVLMSAIIITQEPLFGEETLDVSINVAGVLACVYIAGWKGVNFVKAFKAPPGEWGFDLTDEEKYKALIIGLVWILFIIVGAVAAARASPDVIPIKSLILYGGGIAVLSIGGNKAVAAAAAGG